MISIILFWRNFFTDLVHGSPCRTRGTSEVAFNCGGRTDKWRQELLSIILLLKIFLWEAVIVAFTTACYFSEWDGALPDCRICLSYSHFLQIWKAVGFRILNSISIDSSIALFSHQYQPLLKHPLNLYSISWHLTLYPKMANKHIKHWPLPVHSSFLK